MHRLLVPLSIFLGWKASIAARVLAFKIFLMCFEVLVEVAAPGEMLATAAFLYTSKCAAWVCLRRCHRFRAGPHGREGWCWQAFCLWRYALRYCWGGRSGKNIFGLRPNIRLHLHRCWCWCWWGWQNEIIIPIHDWVFSRTRRLQVGWEHVDSGGLCVGVSREVWRVKWVCWVNIGRRIVCKVCVRLLGREMIGGW